MTFPEGFNTAIEGLAIRNSDQAPLAVYEYSKIIDVLLSQGLNRDEAESHFRLEIIPTVGPGILIIQYLPT